LSQFHQSSNQRASHPPTTPPAVLTGGPAPSPPLHPVRQGDDTATSDASGQSTAKLDMTTHGKERQGRPRSRTSPERKGKQVSPPLLKALNNDLNCRSDRISTGRHLYHQLTVDQ
jgi:hypothetical protein